MNNKQERIAKFIAHSGFCSRRDAEKLIAAGRVSVNGEILKSPAFNVDSNSKVTIDGKEILRNQISRLWLYHKPKGLVTTHKDEQGRKTVFETLPDNLPRVVSVGRLDINSEGLLLLTNDGELAGKISHPKTGLKRHYRVRIFGHPNEKELDSLRKGITTDGIKLEPAEIIIEQKQGRNCWLSVTLSEGKNREIRKMFESINCPVNRLIRTAFGPFKLGKLKPGETKEVANPF